MNVTNNFLFFETGRILRKMSIYKFLDCSKDLPINFIGEFFSEKLRGFSLREKGKIIDLFKINPKYFQKLINRRTNFYSDKLSTILAILLSEAMGNLLILNDIYLKIIVLT